MDACEQELLCIFRQGKRTYNRIQKAVIQEKLTFTSLYDSAKSALSRQLDTSANLYMVEKSAYLLAAYLVFCQLCISNTDEQHTMKNQLNRALLKMCKDSTRPNPLFSDFAKYIISMLEQGNVARVLGVNSESAKLWYDSSKGVFYLPFGTHLDSIRNLFPDNFKNDINKLRFERELDSAGIIRTAQRGTQRRRSFDVVVAPNRKRISVLAVYATPLFEYAPLSDKARSLSGLAYDSSPRRGYKSR